MPWRFKVSAGEVALEQPMVNAWLTQLRTHILGVDTDAVVQAERWTPHR